MFEPGIIGKMRSTLIAVGFNPGFERFQSVGIMELHRRHAGNSIQPAGTSVAIGRGMPIGHVLETAKLPVTTP